MQVNFDGLRRNATKSVNALQGLLEKVLREHKDDFYNNEDDEIKEAFNSVAMFINSFNCLMSEKEGYSWLDIEVKQFEEADEDEES